MEPHFWSSSSESEECQPPKTSHPVIDITNSESDDSVIDLCRTEKKLQFKGITDIVRNAMEDLSTASKLVQVLMQQRTAEHAASSIEEYTSSSASECPVCREVLFASQACTTMCGHIFHSACIHKMAQYKRASHISCPICRADVHIGELISINSGLPQPPAIPSPLEKNEELGTSKEKKNSLDRALTNALSAFGKLTKEKNVFQRSLTAIKRQVKLVLYEAKKDANMAKSHYLARIENIKTKEREVQNTASRIAVREERLLVSQEKLNKDLTICAKQKSDLRAIEGSLQFKMKEVEQKTSELEEKLFDVTEKERRLTRLKEALYVKKQELERKRSQPSMPESPKQRKKRRVESEIGASHTAQSSPFASKLRLPSAMNRPPPPRRAGQKQMLSSTVGLLSFAPKRSSIQRPMGGVAQRDSNRRRV